MPQLSRNHSYSPPAGVQANLPGHVEAIYQHWVGPRGNFYFISLVDIELRPVLFPEKPHSLFRPSNDESVGLNLLGE